MRGLRIVKPVEIGAAGYDQIILLRNLPQLFPLCLVCGVVIHLYAVDLAHFRKLHQQLHVVVQHGVRHDSHAPGGMDQIQYKFYIRIFPLYQAGSILQIKQLIV